MKALAVLALCLVASPVFSQVHVRPTVTKRGTYKPAHNRTSPDHTQRNNYSAKGNVNPYTGKVGTRRVKH